VVDDSERRLAKEIVTEQQLVFIIRVSLNAFKSNGVCVLNVGGCRGQIAM